jgi:hypothetical protein
MLLHDIIAVPCVDRTAEAEFGRGADHARGDRPALRSYRLRGRVLRRGGNRDHRRCADREYRDVGKSHMLLQSRDCVVRR